MGWLSIILYIAMHIPDLISIFKKIMELIHGMPVPQSTAVKSLFNDAIAFHKETKDASKVKNVCLGIGCPPELLK